MPAIASFAIFQFLWVWNDLLVALVFATGRRSDHESPGGDHRRFGQNADLLTAGAFISIIVPLIVFFALQRYFVRGLLAGRRRADARVASSALRHLGSGE